MLKEILTYEQCKNCKGCCRFDENDVWIYPKVSKKMSEKIKEKYGISMQKLGENTYGFEKIKDKNGLYVCPALSEHGCILGDDRPVSCSYYPIVLVKENGKIKIALDPFCKEFDGKIETIKEYVKNDLAKKLFSYAKEFPDDVFPPFDNMIVLFEEE